MFSTPVEICPNNVDVGRLNGPKQLQPPTKMVGREPPHHFGWVLKALRAVKTPAIDKVRGRVRHQTIKYIYIYIYIYINIKIYVIW